MSAGDAFAVAILFLMASFWTMMLGFAFIGLTGAVRRNIPVGYGSTVRIAVDVIERTWGWEKFIDYRNAEGRNLRGAKLRMVDCGDYGWLWKTQVSHGRWVYILEVYNSTPDEKGVRKAYFMRVDNWMRPIHADGAFGFPQRRTVRNAVASTFGLYGWQYKVAAAS